MPKHPPFRKLHGGRSGHLLRLALRSLANRLLGGLLRRLLGSLANRLLRGLADHLLRRLLRSLLYLLSHFRFLIFTCVWSFVGWELIDSPCVFVVEFGLQ